MEAPRVTEGDAAKTRVVVVERRNEFEPRAGQSSRKTRDCRALSHGADQPENVKDQVKTKRKIPE